MSNTTIAYSHKGGFWKTKYTFVAGWMARVGRLFYSGDKTPTTQAAWRHNSDTAKRTAYYIDPGTTPIGSGISVSFNKNVSQNKIYKSFSIEGTSNINGANTFVVNSDSDDVKSGSMGRLTNKGGYCMGT
jgi:acetyl-CoA carboxylase carboxyltransferase component